MQVRAGRAHATTAVDRAVEARKPFLTKAVHVTGERIARFLPGREECIAERICRRSALEHDRPAPAAPLICAREAGLHALEVRQTVCVVPLLEAGHRRPTLEIKWVAA